MHQCKKQSHLLFLPHVKSIINANKKTTEKQYLHELTISFSMFNKSCFFRAVPPDDSIICINLRRVQKGNDKKAKILLTFKKDKNDFNNRCRSNNVRQSWPFNHSKNKKASTNTQQHCNNTITQQNNNTHLSFLSSSSRLVLAASDFSARNRLKIGSSIESLVMPL